MSGAVSNPEIPYVGVVEGGLTPGKMVKIQGKVPENALRFAINYQLGPVLNPRDDVAIHIAPRFPEGFITRNHIQSMAWGPEENEGPMWIQPGTNFEIIVLCEYTCYKIAINGKHYTEFNHRMPYQKVSHLVIDGDVEVHSIFYESIPIGPPPQNISMMPDNVGPLSSGGLYPRLNPPHGPQPNLDGYNNPSSYGYQPPPQDKDESSLGGLDKVGLAVGGLIAAGGVAAAMHAMNKNKNKGDEPEHGKSDASKSESGLGGLGALGAALASSLAANAHAQQGYPPMQGGGMLGSILDALGGSSGSHAGYNKPSSDPLSGALGSLLGGGGGGGGGGAGSLLNSFLGGSGGSHQQPQYQPTGGYGGYQPSGGYNSHQEQGNDFLKDIGGALFKSALDGLSRNKSHDRDDRHHSSQPPNYGQSYNDFPPSHPPPQPPRAPSPHAPGGGRLSAAEISRGLGLGDDED